MAHKDLGAAKSHLSREVQVKQAKSLHQPPQYLVCPSTWGWFLLPFELIAARVTRGAPRESPSQDFQL